MRQEQDLATFGGWRGGFCMSLYRTGPLTLFYSNMVFSERRFYCGSGDIIHLTIWLLSNISWSNRKSNDLKNALKSFYQIYPIFIQKYTIFMQKFCYQICSTFKQKSYYQMYLIFIQKSCYQIYILIPYWMLRPSVCLWFCPSVILFVRYRNHFPVVQFQNQAHFRNPHGTGQVFKTIWVTAGASFFFVATAPCGAPRAPQIIIIVIFSFLFLRFPNGSPKVALLPWRVREIPPKAGVLLVYIYMCIQINTCRGY